MPDTVKNQKFNVLFDWFDQGKDGYLTAGDFEQMADMFAALAQEHDTANANAMRAAFELWWTLLRDLGDADADGRVTRPEFLDLMESSVTNPDNFESAVLAIADALREAALTYPPDWIEEAMRKAVLNNARHWRYVEAILTRWKEKGRDATDRRDSEKDRRRYIEGELSDFIEH